MPIWKITYAGGVHMGHAISQAEAVLIFERLYPGQGGSIAKVEELSRHADNRFHHPDNCCCPTCNPPAAARARRDE